MRVFAIAALTGLIVACTPPAAPQIRPVAAGETRVDGLVTQIEAGAYPQYTVTIQPEGGGEALALYLNVESGADLNSQELRSFDAANVMAYYTTVDDPLLISLQSAAGAAIVTPDGAVATDGLSEVVGVLSGADAVTGSDLPDVISVTDAQGTAINFEYYVTADIVAVNGQQVTARYRPNIRNEITLMHPAPAPRP